MITVRIFTCTYASPLSHLMKWAFELRKYQLAKSYDVRCLSNLLKNLVGVFWDIFKHCDSDGRWLRNIDTNSKTSKGSGAIKVK